jgi:hypothetical protein
MRCALEFSGCNSIFHSKSYVNIRLEFSLTIIYSLNFLSSYSNTNLLVTRPLSSSYGLVNCLKHISLSLVFSYVLFMINGSAN